MRRTLRLFVLYGLAVILAACSAQKAPQPQFYADTNPPLLSDWGVLGVAQGELQLGQGVVPYSLATPLFTDYAHKLRTIWVPNGVATYQGTEALDFPVGTVISKTFYYPQGTDGRVTKAPDLQPVNHKTGLSLAKNLLVETRLLVRREAGWEPLSYVWNAEETEAKLTRIGAIMHMELEDGGETTPFAYAVPNINQCAGCHAPNHTTKILQPLGPKPQHLNTAYSYADGALTSLAKLEEVGFLAPATPPLPTVKWDDDTQDLNTRARAYMDVNCAHCHNPVGPADTSGLHLNPENESRPHLGICKQPIAAGGGTGGLLHDIKPGDATQSIFVYRMQSRDPGEMMPALGRSLAHSEGVALIADWINAMDAGCE